MSGLVFGGVFGAVDDPLLRGLTALQPVVVAGETVLAGLGRNGASTFRIEADGTLTLVQQYSFGGAFLPGVSPSLVPLSLAGMAVHAVAGQFPGGVAFVTIGAGGSIAPTAAPGGWALPTQSPGIPSHRPCDSTVLLRPRRLQSRS